MVFINLIGIHYTPRKCYNTQQVNNNNNEECIFKNADFIVEESTNLNTGFGGSAGYFKNAIHKQEFYNIYLFVTFA